MGTGQPARLCVSSVEEAAAHAARLKVDVMVKKKVRHHEEVQVGDMVHIWRDGSGWIGPAPVTQYQVTIDHENYEKTASRN